MLVGRRVAEREFLHLVGLCRRAGAPHHKSNWLLPLDFVGDRNHAGLHNIGVALQHALDIAGIDVFAPRNEHIVTAPDKEIKSIFIAAKHVAGNIESVLRHGRFKVGPVVITVHQGRTFDLQDTLIGLSFSLKAQLDSFMRVADGELGRREPPGVFAEHHRPGFGRAIGIHDRGIGKSFTGGTHQAFAHRRRAHSDIFHRGKIGMLKAGLAQHHRDHRRHRGQPGAAKTLDGIDIGAGIELRQQHDGSIGGHRQLGQRQSIHMKHRRCDQKHMMRKVCAAKACLYDPQMALMREDDSFGHTGRARSIKKHGRLA